MKPERILAALLVATALAVGGAARAEGDDTAAPGAPIHPSERTGWTIGLAGGMADLHTYPEKQDEILASGNGIEFDVGRAINQRALALATAQLVHVGGTTHAIYGAGLEYYFTQRIWARGGLGVANYKADAGPAAPDGTGGTPKIDRWSAGGFAGVGVEWLQTRTLAFDGQIAWTGSSYPNKTRGDISALNVSLMLGVRWYGL